MQQHSRSEQHIKYKEHPTACSAFTLRKYTHAPLIRLHSDNHDYIIIGMYDIIWPNSIAQNYITQSVLVQIKIALDILISPQKEAFLSKEEKIWGNLNSPFQLYKSSGV